MQGAPGSTAEMAVEFTGGVRSYFDGDVANVYDEAVAAKRSEALKTRSSAPTSRPGGTS